MTDRPALHHRLARPQDLAAVHAIASHPAVLPFLGHDAMPIGAFQGVLQGLIDGGGFHVVELDGVVAGFYRITRLAGRAAHVAQLGTLAVAPAWQGRGLAHAMIRAALAHLAGAGVRRVDLMVEADNPRAQAFYRRLGFRHEATLRGYYRRAGEANDVDEWLMVRFLGEEDGAATPQRSRGVPMARAADASVDPPAAPAIAPGGTLYAACVVTFQRGLGRLQHLLDVAEAHARAHGLDPQALLQARLAPDMLPLERQALIAAHFALRTAWPMAGRAIPPEADFPPSFEGLRRRLAHVQARLDELPASAFEGLEAQSRRVDSQAGSTRVSLPAAEFLNSYALPNFYFHLAMTYALLRQQGVPVGKADFDGWHGYPALR